MKLFDLFLEELKTFEEPTETSINEGIIPLSPLLAFLSLRKNIFKEAKDRKKFIDIVKGQTTKIRAAAITGKEKISAKTGGKSMIGNDKDATVYTFTGEQLDFLAEFQDKYGKEIIKEIQDFRTNILAPYQVIKRAVKKFGRSTDSDRIGMSHRDFQESLESGRRKIERMGGDYYKKNQEFSKTLKEVDESLSDLKKIRDSIKNGSPINKNKISEIQNNYYFRKESGKSSEDFGGVPLEKLQKAYEEMMRGYRALEDDPTASAVRKTVGRNIDLRRHGGATSKEEREFLQRDDKFSEALALYSVRRLKDEKDFKKSGNDVVVSGESKSFFLKVVEILISNQVDRRRDYFSSYNKHRERVKFTENEKKIWKLRPTAKEFSSDLNDYYQGIKDQDFKGVVNIQKNPKVLEAEKEIEKQVKRFEREIAKKVDIEDFKELKRLRIINNLITLKDLDDPQNLFKSSSEIEAENKNKKSSETKDGDESESESEDNKKEDGESTGGEMSFSEFKSFLEKVATQKYDTVGELNKDKQKLEKMEDSLDATKTQMNKIERLLFKTKNRKKIEAQKIRDILSGYEYDDSDKIIEINDIEKKVYAILNRKYFDANTLARDVDSLKLTITHYKKQNPDKYEKELGSISYLFNELSKKHGVYVRRD